MIVLMMEQLLIMTFTWLDFTLKMDQSYNDLSRNSVIPSNWKGWTIEQKKFLK